MALSPKEREKIVEEETLRFETRQNLHRGSCGKHRPRRYLWWVIAAIVAVAAWHHFACGGMGCHRGGMWGHDGHHCVYQDQGDAAGVEPGQPVAPKK